MDSLAQLYQAENCFPPEEYFFVVQDRPPGEFVIPYGIFFPLEVFLYEMFWYFWFKTFFI